MDRLCARDLERCVLISSDPVRSELAGPLEIMSSILMVQKRKQAQRGTEIYPRVTQQ